LSDNIRHRKDSILALREAREKEAAVQSAVLYLFRRMAEGGEIDDATIRGHAPLFDLWRGEDILAPGAIRRCPEDARLYRYGAEPLLPVSGDGDGAKAAAFAGSTQREQQGLAGKKQPKPPSKNPDYWKAIG